MNFDINVFQKTIDPLIGNDYSDGLNYWVYLVKQTLDYGQTVQADKAIYKNPNAQLNPMTDELFELLYNDLLDP